MKKILLLSLFIAIVGSVIAVVMLRQKYSTPGTPENFSIVTSFYPLHFFTKEIVENNGHVINITPSGSEPHDYEPTAQQIAAMERSALIILQGGTFEAWGDTVLASYGEKVIFVNDNSTTEKTRDPHTWLDPLLAGEHVKKISQTVQSIDPSNKSDYERRTQIILDQLQALHNDYNQGLSSCQRRDFITSHAAFGHLARRYNLNQVSISGISPDNEPTAKDMAAIVTFAKEHAVRYIFFERLVSPKLAETIAREVGAETLILDPIEGITDQQMKDGVNYFTMMRENLKALQTALQCQT